MNKAMIEDYPSSVVVTDADPRDTLNCIEPSQTFSFAFGDGELYKTRAQAREAAEWFLRVAAPIL